MFKPKNDKKLDLILKDMINGRSRLGSKYRSFNVEQIWRDSFGKSIDQYTTKVTLKADTLYVTLSSSALRQELNYRKEKMLAKLNADIEYREIKELVFN